DGLELVVSVTDIPAHYPLAAGNALPISEMETGIDRSIVGLTARLQPCACRSRFERCISNCTRQIRSPNTLSPCSSATRLSNDCPIYVDRRRWTIGNNIGDPACKSARYGRRLWSAVDRFTLLSRRQHRFESGRGRQFNQYFIRAPPQFPLTFPEYTRSDFGRHRWTCVTPVHDLVR